ncbi:hypothetical protein H112_06705 [Trichophyton rubrum D6]|uniref:Uncharacterized protein n=3 Tax=Trichophyton TaxID=5550 RepID=A0A080WJE0_TRIRC|nr:uncharacterized protein TERG_11795 [Trichophyton rubrum CBS 118892]EZF12395.1 hypothetical protein H100_06721 [Trichophyton rubrum MR850]EZF39365.1 hypothetical protein H102_06688 [Trichophyton rubrum CBS 100081]EZF49819.1 hypothetical protein H103_06712 [Trichophyton rubrum CBS 288.86]EZF60393.1 hypothetical protein H104_06667 [Trichophyton rubrum CBS 289.86]EZF71101.1 hypothetical protein H105_06725 [Trichophyton soudanense CBS 452.61]EZF81840.1 hypothetical protein H110_06709 [Trichophy
MPYPDREKKKQTSCIPANGALPCQSPNLSFCGGPSVTAIFDWRSIRRLHDLTLRAMSCHSYSHLDKVPRRPRRYWGKKGGVAPSPDNILAYATFPFRLDI